VFLGRTYFLDVDKVVTSKCQDSELGRLLSIRNRTAAEKYVRAHIQNIPFNHIHEKKKAQEEAMMEEQLSEDVSEGGEKEDVEDERGMHTIIKKHMIRIH
jgi:hypothetical protein